MKFPAWRTYGAAVLAGVAAALAMPPLLWLPLGVVGIVVFVRQWDSAPTPKAAFLRGWAWGVGHFAVGSYWMVEAFFVPPADFALLGPPAVLAFSIGLGLFPGLVAGIAHWLSRRWPHLGGRYRRLVVLAILWTVSEWVRGHLFTSYAWNPLGHVWAFAPALLQGAAVIGVYGLGTLTFAILAAPVAGWRASLVALGLVGVAGVAGLAAMPPPDAVDEGGPVIRIVQPNVPQSEKWASNDRAAHFQKLIDLSRRPGFDKLAAVVWPETAVPFIVEPGSEALPAMAQAAPPNGYLLGGMARGTLNRADGVWNSLLVIDPKGVVQAYYDKVHLVPFGEYIPWHKEFPPLSGAIGRGSFEVGSSFVTLALPGLPPFSPTICYEAIFPGAVTGPGARPRWLVNVTNDAWFGTSSGPYQHLVSARLRAIEEGLPMIRAANTGVSAVIDAYGRVLASLDMERQGVVDHVLPPSRGATPYAKWGDWTVLALLLLLGVCTGLKRRK